MSSLNLCVLGAGVVGLTTAIELQKQFQNATITLIADKFNEQTTSYVAPALFIPGLGFKGPTQEKTRELFVSSYQHWNDLLTNNIGSEVGISRVSGYFLSNNSPNDVRNAYIEELIPGFRLLSPDELKQFPSEWKFGSYLTTLVIENCIYLPWATQQFLTNGGKIVVNKIECFSELVGKYDAVFNCTGVEAISLCNDTSLTSIRGQVCKVDAPWVDKFYCVGNMTCVIPGYEGVCLGTTWQFGSSDPKYDKDDELDIMQRCEALLPELHNAKIKRRLVGLRPYRDPIRLEYELMRFDNGSIRVLHNYGHSGNGVTGAPGTAKYAIQLLREVLPKSDK